jgi:apolipoprotein N-acyltransferase
MLMATRFAGWPLWARCILAAVAGAFGALGQAPFDQPIALVLSLAVAFWLWRAEALSPFSIGWAFGTGYFALALVWIIEPFQVDVERHGWMAPFALLFLSAGLALFWGVAFRFARWLSVGALGLVLCWAFAELLRAYIFTGFPWASPAQVVIDGPASVLLSWVGPHGALAVMLLLAALVSAQAPATRRLPFRMGQILLLCAAALALYLPEMRPPVERTGHHVRLIQPNAAQHLKWRRDMVETFYARQLALTEAAPKTPDQRPDLIVWPETAIPWTLEAAGPVLAQIAAAANGRPVALGVLRFEDESLRNALAVIDPAGQVTELYDKYHLVPFGEYVPLSAWVSRLGLQGLAANMGGFSAGPGPKLLDFGTLGRALPLICYEAVFAHRVGAMPERADFLLHVTNDAWFGQYAGPQQHLAQARMRAIEQGLPVLRAANTGISALIDPLGRVEVSLPLGQAGFLDVAVPRPLAPTLYSRTGDAPIAVLLLFGLIFCVFARYRRRHRVWN